MSSKEVKVAHPFHFKGDSTDIKRAKLFLRLCKGYIEANPDMFTTDKVKINYILSQLQEGPAGYWAQAKSTQAERTGLWGTYNDFLDEFTMAFISNNQESEATDKLINIKQESTVTAYNSEFRSLAEEAGVIEFRFLSRFYLRGLRDDLSAEVVRRKPTATTMQTLYDRALEAEADYAFQKAIHIKQIRTAPFRNFNRQFQNRQPWRNNYQGRNFNQNRFQRLSNEERNRFMQEGRCFICKQVGHISRNCPNRSKTNIRSIQEDEQPTTGGTEESPVDKVKQMMQELSIQDFGKLMNQLGEEHQEPKDEKDFQ